MNVHHEEKCWVVRLFISKPFSVTYAWLTRPEGQGQGQHLFLRPTEQPAPGSRGCRDTSGAGQWQECVRGEHGSGGTTSGQQTSVHLIHIHPGIPGNTQQTVCFLPAFTAQVYVHDPVQEPPRAFLPLLTSLVEAWPQTQCLYWKQSSWRIPNHCSAQGSTSQI